MKHLPFEGGEPAVCSAAGGTGGAHARSALAALVALAAIALVWPLAVAACASLLPRLERADVNALPLLSAIVVFMAIVGAGLLAALREQGRVRN